MCFLSITRHSWLITPYQPMLHFRIGQRLVEFGVLTARGLQQVQHPDRLIDIGGEEGRVQRDVANRTTRHVEARQPIRVQYIGWGVFRKDAPPDVGALSRIGKWK